MAAGVLCCGHIAPEPGRVPCCLFLKFSPNKHLLDFKCVRGSAEVSLARTQQGGTQHSSLGGACEWWSPLPMHRALSRLGKAWWVLGHPGWMGTGPRCPELGAATGRILTVAVDGGYFQGIYQYRLRPWALPVSGQLAILALGKRF